MKLAAFWDEKRDLDPGDLGALKRLTRVAMTQITSGRKLHTQALVRNLRSHQRG